MEKYVVSRELAEKLKEAGFPQKTIWYWEQSYSTWEMGQAHEDYDKTPDSKRRGVEIDGWRVVDDYRHHIGVPEVVFNWWWDEVQQIHEAHIAATMTDELFEQLPEHLTDSNGPSALEVHPLSDGQWGVGYQDFMGNVSQRLPDALAQLWLWCKANGYIKAEETE